MPLLKMVLLDRSKSANTAANHEIRITDEKLTFQLHQWQVERHLAEMGANDDIV